MAARSFCPGFPGQTFNFTGKGFSGTDSGHGVVSADGNFFAYVLVNSSTGQAVWHVRRDADPDQPVPDRRDRKSTTCSMASSPGALPFVPGPNPTIEAAATTSPLYSIYAPNLGPNANQGAQAMQVTMAISGQGVSQRSYMGGFVGDYVTDYTTNTIMNSGKYIGSYHANGTTAIDRLTSSQVTAQTANGNAIYGTGAVPDAMVFVSDGAVSTAAGGGTTTRTDQAAMEQLFHHVFRHSLYSGDGCRAGHQSGRARREPDDPHPERLRRRRDRVDGTSRA